MTEFASIRFNPTPELNPEGDTSLVWYTDPTSHACGGFWASDDFAAPVEYTEAEFVTLLEGEVLLTDASGHSETYKAGDSFLIPAGFKGHWQTVKPVRKFFMIYEAKGL